MKPLALLGATAFAALVIGTGVASASIVGTVYLDDPNSTDASILPSSSLAHATFTAPGISFDTGNSDATTISAFLGNPTFTNEQNGFDPTHLTDNSFLLINAQAYLLSGNNAFVVGHDDGVVVTFPGLNGGNPVVNAPGPTSLDLTPFNVSNPGAAGLFNFTLQYAECCGGPADLDMTVNGAPVSTTPLPATLPLFAGGLGVLGWATRRKKQRMDQAATA